MAEENVLIETNIFTDIINEIQDTASDCVLSERPLGSTNVWEHTVMIRSMKYSEQI